ncbi:MAG: DNA translocase FtsK 4TM domain-containing protein [Zoogloeaceae bacterium]|jgi:S-DNA-T family DNA segregation ATPase FtsK/SpoIIIE|nr:DNA translocase FtsK 4TM domain-containing protein [Zoogloeaceae bacterium]
MKEHSDMRSDAPPLPGKIRRLLQESLLLLLVALALFLMLALFGYHPDDPGWSRATGALIVENPAGRAGAWLSDLLFYVFGLSAWCLVFFCLFALWRGARAVLLLREDLANAESAPRGLPAREEKPDRRPFYIALSGFLLFFLSSAALLALRFYSWGTRFPEGAGGVLGHSLAHTLSDTLGISGATLLLIAFLAGGWSVFSGTSWLNVFERLGEIVENAVALGARLREYFRERGIARLAEEEREAVLEEEKRRAESREPVLIEAPEPVPVSPKATRRIEQEKKIAEEKKRSLFPETLAFAEGGLPPLSLLDPLPPQVESVSSETLEYTSRLIERKLADFGVQVTVLAALPGPVITRYEIEPAIGVKGAQIVNLARDLARSLSMVSVRVVETVPGKSCMALELPNPRRQVVKLSEIISSKPWNDMASPLTITLGKDIGGQPVVADLAKMPHLLVAGTTGSGKSVGVNAMILSLLYKSAPDAVRLILIDPKMLELSIYEGIPHLLAPVVTDMRQAANALNWCVGEMERRYRLMSALGVRNLAGFNAKIHEAEKRGERMANPFSLTPETPEPLAALPYIVVVIDELADLMMVAGKKVEELIARLAQKARAAGLHLVLATQRPSVDVITGLIKANIPTRISFQVSSKVDSRTILDQMGAENLLGQGDMLYLPPGSGYPHRVHGAFVSDEEVHRVVEQLKQTGTPQYLDILSGAEGEEGGGGASEEESGDPEYDPLYDQAVEVVLKNKRASISLVQRHLRIGYNRSARLIEAMERSGLVSAMDSRGGREILAPARAEEE